MQSAIDQFLCCTKQWHHRPPTRSQLQHATIGSIALAMWGTRMSEIKRLKKIQGMMKPLQRFQQTWFYCAGSVFPLHWERYLVSFPRLDMSFFTALVALVASWGSRLKALDSPPRSFNSGVDFCMSPRGSRGFWIIQQLRRFRCQVV